MSLEAKIEPEFPHPGAQFNPRAELFLILIARTAVDPDWEVPAYTGEWTGDPAARLIRQQCRFAAAHAHTARPRQTEPQTVEGLTKAVETGQILVD